MRTTYQFLIVSLFVTICCLDGNCQWIPSGGPSGATINDLIHHQGALFAATTGGVFRSMDEGATWELSNAGIPNTISNSLAANGPYIFVGGQSGVYRSSDLGDSWSLQNTGASLEGAYLVYHSGSTLFACSWNFDQGHLYRSEDNGESWLPMSNGLPSGFFAFIVSAMTHTNSHVVLHGFSLSGTHYAYRSIDQGQTWTGGAGTSARDLASDGTRVFLANEYGIHRSLNNGVSWTQVDGSPATAVAFGPDGLFAATSTGVKRSYDNGATWTIAGSGSENFPIEHLTLTDAYVCGGMPINGIARSNIGGGTWSTSNQGLQAIMVNSLAATSSGIWAATNGWGLQRSAYDGNDWNRITTGSMMLDTVFSVVSLPGRVVFSAMHGDLGYIMFSDDEGATWAYAGNGYPGFPGRLYAFGNELFVCGRWGEIRRSTDNGNSWAEIGNAPFENIYSEFTPARIGSHLFASIAGHGLFRSNDDGATWEEITNGLVPANNFWPILAIGNTLFTRGNGSYRSDDLGDTWQLLEGVGIPRTFMEVNGGLVAAGWSSALHLSTDLGTTWIDIAQGSMEYGIRTNDIILAGNEYFAATTTSVWRRSMHELSIPRLGVQPEKKWSLYPNPAHGEVWLELQEFIPGAHYDITDMHGRVLAKRPVRSSPQQVELPSLERGLYVVCLEYEGSRSCRPLVIE